MNDNIYRLQELIEAEKRRIANCKHEFDKPFFNPEIVKEGYGCIQDGGGSDPHWSFEGYKDVKKNRWSRKCKRCGFEEHTYNQNPIITGYEPKF